MRESGMTLYYYVLSSAVPPPLVDEASEDEHGLGECEKQSSEEEETGDAAS